jgi:hypothetical protein
VFIYGLLTANQEHIGDTLFSINIACSPLYTLLLMLDMTKCHKIMIQLVSSIFSLFRETLSSCWLAAENWSAYCLGFE